MYMYMYVAWRIVRFDLLFIGSYSMCICLCSAFSQYNMEQFTPAKVNDDLVSVMY